MIPDDTNRPLHPLVYKARKPFIKGVLMESLIEKDPIKQFKIWIHEAFEEEGELSNAMILSTAGKDHAPHSRVVLLRDISYGGFTFFTNYKSHKALEIEQNSKASLLFFWKEQERQIRIEGIVALLPAHESDAYFASRPFESQVSAWSSKQSEVVENREILEHDFNNRLNELKGKDVSRPPHWGGYVMIPHYFEFWQGRENRLHDRITYTQPSNSDEWEMERLMP